MQRILITDSAVAIAKTTNTNNNGFSILTTVTRISLTSPAPSAPIAKNGYRIAKITARQPILCNVPSNVTLFRLNIISPDNRLMINRIIRRRFGILCFRMSKTAVMHSIDIAIIAKNSSTLSPPNVLITHEFVNRLYFPSFVL